MNIDIKKWNSGYLQNLTYMKMVLALMEITVDIG